MGGLIVTGSAPGVAHRKLMPPHRRPGTNYPRVYPGRYYVTAGGLISYGPDFGDQYRRASLCRPHPQGREASRPAGAGADQDPSRQDEFENGQRLGLANALQCLAAPTR